MVYTIGTSPIALALNRGAGLFGFDLRLGDDLPTPLPDDVSAVIVASHGRGEEEALTIAADAGVPYIGLVASRRRGEAVLSSLGFSPENEARIHTPAGLDIGAQTPEEIALSILAEIVSLRPRVKPEADPDDFGHHHHAPVESATANGVAVDPVCGMTVAAVAASLQVDHKGVTYYFCGPGCRQAFTASPDDYPTDA